MMHRVAALEPWMIEELERLEKLFWNGEDLTDLLLMVASDGLAVWVPASAPRCLVLTQIVNHRRGRELYLYGIVGAGILEVAEEVIADLKVLAEANGCSMIGAQGLVPGWDRITKKLGFRVVATHYLMELSDGQ